MEDPIMPLSPVESDRQPLRREAGAVSYTDVPQPASTLDKTQSENQKNALATMDEMNTGIKDSVAGNPKIESEAAAEAALQKQALELAKIIGIGGPNTLGDTGSAAIMTAMNEAKDRVKLANAVSKHMEKLGSPYKIEYENVRCPGLGPVNMTERKDVNGNGEIDRVQIKMPPAEKTFVEC
jgi:hypothetical protein